MSAGSMRAGSLNRVDGVALAVDDAVLSEVRFDANGLVPAVVQEAESRTVLTVAYMNEESLRRTLQSGRTWFFSRSRQELWPKGETSGAFQYVREVLLDCDGDAVVVVVDQHGAGACHTGAFSCFERSIGRGPGVARPDPSPGRAAPT